MVASHSTHPTSFPASLPWERDCHSPWRHIPYFPAITCAVVKHVFLVFILHVASHSMMGRRFCCPSGWRWVTGSKPPQASLLAADTWNTRQLDSKICRLGFPRASRLYSFGGTVKQRGRTEKWRKVIWCSTRSFTLCWKDLKHFRNFELKV